MNGTVTHNTSDECIETEIRKGLDEHDWNPEESLKSSKPSIEFTSLISRLVSAMASSVTDYLDESASLVPYGSVASGLIVNRTSIDLMLFIPPGPFDSLFGAHGSDSQYSSVAVASLQECQLRQSMRKALARLAELLTVFNGLFLVKLTGVVPLSSASAGSRLPVLTMLDPESLLTIEITCNHPFALFSTRLLKCYTALLPGLDDMVVLVKHWARKHAFLGCSPGTLSGFAWSLLCVFYCQSLGLPSLQALSTERKQMTDPFGSQRRCDVGFAETLDDYEAGAQDGQRLFIGFLEFYGNFWDWETSVVSVRLGRAISVRSAENFIRQTVCEGSSIIIEDPFDVKRNVAQQAGSLHRVRECMHHSFDFLHTIVQKT